MIRIIAVSLLATVLLETGFAWSMGIAYKKDLVLLALGSVITNPAVVWLYYFFCNTVNPFALVLFLESMAIIVEGWILQCYSESICHPWKVAISINLFSYFVGLIL